MTFRGTIENGKLVLDDGTRLPDGTRVDVEVSGRSGASKKPPRKGVDPIATIASLAISTGDPHFADEHNRHAYGSETTGKRTRTATRRPAPSKRPKPARRGAR